jgi:hypothetical protein
MSPLAVGGMNRYNSEARFSLSIKENLVSGLIRGLLNF